MRSRYRHKSARCRSSHPIFGRMTRSHSLVTDEGELFIENANCRRRIAEFGEWRDLAVPPPLHAAEPHGGYLIQRLCSGRAKKTNPASFCHVAERETEHAEGGRKRYESTEARFRVTRLRNGGIISRNVETLPIICGKTQVSKITRDRRSVTGAQKSVVRVQRNASSYSF